jgi:quercetin dioxygenase-like cupin family protein
MKTGKIWGTTEIVLATPLIEIHRLTIKPYARCSRHRHERKCNAFIVTHGRLCIEVHKKAYRLIDRTWLEAGEITTVAPGEKHQFVTAEDGAEGFEIYYLAPLSEDIIRDNVGALL